MYSYVKPVIECHSLYSHSTCQGTGFHRCPLCYQIDVTMLDTSDDDITFNHLNYNYEGNDGLSDDPESHEESERGGDIVSREGRKADPVDELLESDEHEFPDGPRTIMKPDKYNGKCDWTEYLCHFESCAELSEWDDRTKCLILATSLQEGARRYYAGLNFEERRNYTRLVSTLKRRFGTEHKHEYWASKLEMRKRKPGESIADLSDDIRAMTLRVYHDFCTRAQEQLALKHLYRLIETEMKVKCIENKCTTLTDAVDVVERYETLYEDNQDEERAATRAIALATSQDAMVMTALGKMTDKLDKMVPGKWRRGSVICHTIICHTCKTEGHYSRSCPDNN